MTATEPTARPKYVIGGEPSPKPRGSKADDHSKTEQIIVVGHTHWDREWYLPFEGFRMRLVSMMDELCDILENDPAYRCFVLDGQAILLEDYLEVRPEAEERVRRLLRDNRIVAGPWYTAVDTFLPDPESLVRNLQLGRWAVRRLGGREMPVGHLPDTFGFNGQIPQLLQHFGYEYAFVWRGLHPENEGAAVWWESPDRSRVLVLRPPGGYCEGARAIFDPPGFLSDEVPNIAALQDKEPYPYRLFVAGCDHFRASERLPWLTEQLGAMFDAPARIGSLEEMADLVRDSGAELETVRGEQRDPCLGDCPFSVCGTRIPLKQANARVEELLLGTAEPLHALSELVGGGADREHLRWAWRMLAQNHPHDSIPGCSTDTVHQEMHVRFARAAMIALDAAQRGAKRLGQNLFPGVRGELGAIGVVGLAGGRGRMRVRLHGTEEGVPAFRIVDTDGSEVPYAVLRRGREFINYHRLEDAFATAARASYVNMVAPHAWIEERRKLPRAHDVWYSDIEMELEAPHAGYRILRLEPTASGQTRTEPAARSVQKRNEIANEKLRVWADPDGVFIADGVSGKTYGPVLFSHQGDAGDEYTAAPIPEPPTLFTVDAARAQVVKDGLGDHLVLPIRATVPARLAANKQKRVGRVRLEGTMVVELLGDRANIKLSLLNTARDFDLRLIARVPGATRARSGAPFGVEDRSEELKHSHPRAPQRWLPDFPLRGWLAANTADGSGLAILARGLYEGAVRRVSDGIELAPTLLRGVGYLSRTDVPTDDDRVSPDIATPDAQCLGPQQWELALLPFGPGEIDTLPVRAEQFLRPPSPFPIQWSAGNAPAAMSLFSGDSALVVSALKPTETGMGAMIHVHNPTTNSRQAKISGQRSRLDETPIDGDNTLEPFAVAAWKLGSKRDNSHTAG